jgi:serine protease Do
VSEKSPAAKAGLNPDDVITSINGQPVNDNRSLILAIGRLPIGQSFKVEVLRDGRPQTLTVTLEQAPQDYGRRQPRNNMSLPRNTETVSTQQFGLELTDLSAERAEAYGLKTDAALVVRVDQDSPAAQAGLSRGLVIAKVDRKDVHSAEEAKEALERADAQKGAMVHVRSLTGGTAILLLKPTPK